MVVSVFDGKEPGEVNSPGVVNMECLKPYKASGMEFPCGSCRACRVNRTQEWAVRIMHESDKWENANFTTLTYADEYLPKDASLDKRDAQLFLKRLRKNTKRKFKYYLAGEYGDITNRPHYHVIFLGFDLGEEDKELITECWGKGNIKIKGLGWDSARYVASYVQKKYTGKLAKEIYGEKQIPFQLCSKGMGLDYVKQNKTQLEQKLHITMNGKKIPIPRYYKKKLKLPETAYDKIQKEKIMKERRYYEDRKMTKEEIKNHKINKRLQKTEEFKTKDEMFKKDKI